MPILGKILGGTVGFMVGGPLGALAGTFIGNYFDKEKGHPVAGVGASLLDKKNVTLAIALIALCAKMAKADGLVSSSEISVLKKIFKSNKEEEGFIANIFNKAKGSSDGFEIYAEQLADLFRDDKAVLENFLLMLLAVAKADGKISSSERVMLFEIARIFGFNQGEFRRITSIVESPEEISPYALLQVDESADNASIKKAYFQLVKEKHPDTLIAKGMPEEFISAANKKLAAINSAYEKIKEERGF